MPPAPETSTGAPPGGAAGPDPVADARVSALSDRIICYCGCGNKVVLRCYCGTADSLRDEIRAQIAAGATDDQTLAHFVARYGEQILASPAPRGFNLAAWIAPSAALLGGAALALLVLWRWRRRTRAEMEKGPPAAAAPSSGDPYEKAFEAEYAARRD